MMRRQERLSLLLRHTALRYVSPMPALQRSRQLHRVIATCALAALLAACAHLPAVVIPQAVPASSQLVVFDIDGTLTPTVARIFTARPDGSYVARLYAQRGYRIVYLTARAPALQGTLQRFLSRHAFPAGDLLAPKSRAENRAPAGFKARVLDGYRTRGWEIAAAYGDSSSDFQAYATAGVPREHVFALRRVGAAACQPGAWVECLPGWEVRRAELEKGGGGS